MKSELVIAALLSSFLIGFIGGHALMTAAQHRRPEERYTAVAQEALPKTVIIKVHTIVPQFTFTMSSGTLIVELSTRPVTFVGAGAFITPNGHVLTCAHLFFNSVYDSTITVTQMDGQTFTAELVNADQTKDLALLKINATHEPYFRLADFRSIQAGDEVVAVGNPVGLGSCVTNGIISRLHADEINYDMIQMSAPINPGNSGGPLVDMNGELLGINADYIYVHPFAPVWSGLGFAISGSEINKFLSKFRGLEGAF